MPEWVRKFQMEHHVAVHEDGEKRADNSDRSEVRLNDRDKMAYREGNRSGRWTQ